MWLAFGENDSDKNLESQTRYHGLTVEIELGIGALDEDFVTNVAFDKSRLVG